MTLLLSLDCSGLDPIAVGMPFGLGFGIPEEV